MSLLVLPVHIALVDQSGHIQLEELQTLSADLNEQLTRDFCPIWGVKGTVAAYSKAPVNTWSVVIQNQLSDPGALGYHTDNGKQPISYVEYTPDYSVTVSHETLEMLADPWGNRMHGALLPQGIDPSQVGLNTPANKARVNYLLEVCDPPEANSYQVGNSQLSDFLLPYWYYTARSGRVPAYSHNGYCTEPRQVADGGYVSFQIPSTGNWWQVFNQGGQLQVNDLGSDTTGFSSLREFTDHHARVSRASWR